MLACNSLYWSPRAVCAISFKLNVFLLSLWSSFSLYYWGSCRAEGLWRHEHIEQTSMESSFDGVELRELRGGGGRQSVSPTPASAPWTVATVGCAARGFENASYQQDEEREHQQQGATVSAGCPTSTSANSKVCSVLFGGSYFCFHHRILLNSNCLSRSLWNVVLDFSTLS